MHNDDGDWIEKHSSLWHPWQDKPGIRHTPTYLKDTEISGILNEGPLYTVLNLEDMIRTVAHNGLFVLSNDVLNTRTFTYANELIGDEHVTPYLSRAGNIAALRIAYKRRSGFLVPISTWKWTDEPNKELIQGIARLFTTFGYESTTPSSLSEKVLRATLPTPLQITRPSVWLRRDILDNHTGGRIDMAKPKWYKEVREYDKIKAYPSHAMLVPDPYLCPVIRTRPSLSELFGYATGWFHIVLIAHHCYPSPILINGKEPVEGEVIDRWLWNGELQDCLEAGYTLVEIKRGYGFRAMSDFMAPWVDILYTKYEQCHDEWMKEVIKSMMVGLPGRFLRQPEQYHLIPRTEAKKGDIPLMMHWREPDDRKFSDYVIRAEYEQESTALSYIGSYIVTEMRRELYHRMKEEVEHGQEIVRSYIDCYSVVSRADILCVMENGANMGASTPEYRNIGTRLGEWKEKIYTDVWAEGNRFIGRNEKEGLLDIVAPGLEQGSEGRIEFAQKYYKIVSEYPINP